MRAEELGFDLAWIEEARALAPLVVAAALAPRTSGIRIAASVGAGPNPVTLAEEAAVADLALGGRLVLAVGSGDEELLQETVELLYHAFAARPFTHAGPRWRAPARLAEHERAEEELRLGSRRIGEGGKAAVRNSEEGKPRRAVLPGRRCGRRQHGRRPPLVPK